MRILLLISFLILLTFRDFAGEVGKETAALAALRFLEHRPPPPHLPRPGDAKEVISLSPQGVTLCHVVIFSTGAWAIVSASDATVPVLAYSFEDTWKEEAPPPAFTMWLNHYMRTIGAVLENREIPGSRIRQQWNSLLRPGTAGSGHENAGRSIDPLITSNWNQSPYYNEYCPADPAGPGGHAVAGCVPVCMGQIMYYFRWPETGTGSYSYTDPRYGLLSADFGSTSYRWNNMKNTINSSNPGIAQLLFHLGVSCDLRYGPNGSGMYNHKAAYALRTFFKYHPETQYLYRDSTSLNWDSVLIAHLEKKVPLYYAGWDDPGISGHAFVCDGYQDSSYFHFNFGWGGSYNGYFFTSDLTPGPYNFQLAQEMIINCYPDTVNYTYPVYCQGNTTFNYLQGSFDDGSGPLNPLPPGTSCSWIIDPQSVKDSVTDITLTFSRFNLSPGDTLSVFDGDHTGSPLLASYSGSDLPSPVTSGGNKMLIQLTSSALTTGEGFLAEYNSLTPVWCSGTNIIVADTLELTDGSFGFDYRNNSNCRWKLQTTDEKPLTIYFRSFDTEPGKDFLRIFDFGTGDTLAMLSGYREPGALPDSVTAPTGKMFLIFTSNSSVTASGWEIYYPARPTGIVQPRALTSVSIFPNPARDQINLSCRAGVYGKLDIAIISADGRLVHQEQTGISPGENTYKIGTDHLPAGVYLARIISGPEIQTIRLILY